MTLSLAASMLIHMHSRRSSKQPVVRLHQTVKSTSHTDRQSTYTTQAHQAWEAYLGVRRSGMPIGLVILFFLVLPRVYLIACWGAPPRRRSHSWSRPLLPTRPLSTTSTATNTSRTLPAPRVEPTNWL